VTIARIIYPVTTAFLVARVAPIFVLAFAGFLLVRFGGIHWRLWDLGRGVVVWSLGRLTLTLGVDSVTLALFLAGSDLIFAGTLVLGWRLGVAFSTLALVV
jgi:hypothetical protein